ncbi:MAG: energy-coupling factor ABC transporter ATP-binding protein [Bacillota bacterium]
MEDVHFRYSDEGPEILKGVNFCVEQGCALGLMGPVGAGKTTLLALMAGLFPPGAGRILLKPYRKNAHPVMMLQDPEAQFFLPTVREEISFSCRNAGMRADPDFIRGIMAEAGLSPDLLERSPFSISGGEQRRLSLAVLIALRPRLLLLDEPDAGLDSQGLDALSDTLNGLKKTGLGLIIASHNADFLYRIVDDYLFLRDGSLTGSPRTSLADRAEYFKEIGVELPQVLALQLLLKKEGFSGLPAARSAGELISYLRSLTNP